MNNSDNKGAIIVIVILVLLVLGLGGFIAYDKFFQKEDKTTTINDVKIDLNAFLQVEETLNRLDGAFNDVNSSYCGYIYKDKLKASGIDMGAALFAAVHNDLIASNTPQFLAEARVKNNFDKIFGDNLAYQANSIDGGDAYKINYDSTTGTYAYALAPKVNQYESRYVTINSETKLEKEKIVVTRKVCFVEYGSADGGTTVNKATIYSDSSKSKVIGEITLNKSYLSEKEIMAKYGSKLNTYKYVFNEKSAEEYNFYSIEREKW